MYKNCDTVDRAFVQFLKDNDCYDKFLENMKNDKLEPHYNSIQDIIDDGVQDDCYMAAAFDYAATPEGFDFWEHLDNRWQVIADHYLYIN